MLNDLSRSKNGDLPESLAGGPGCVGVNIGAITVKVAALQGDDLFSSVVTHQGRPMEALKELLRKKEFSGADYFGVSGSRGHITEVAAIQRALDETRGDFDAVASLGGESFLVIPPDGSKDRECAFAQQMRCRKRRVLCAADRTNEARHGGGDRALVPAARSCPWRAGARSTANRTSPTSSTGTKRAPKTSCIRCMTAWPTRWSRCSNRGSGSSNGCSSSAACPEMRQCSRRSGRSFLPRNCRPTRKPLFRGLGLRPAYP